MFTTPVIVSNNWRAKRAHSESRFVGYVYCMHRNISVNFEHAPYISAHAQIISWQRRAEVKNSCFLVDWSCRLPFKEGLGLP